MPSRSRRSPSKQRRTTTEHSSDFTALGGARSGSMTRSVWGCVLMADTTYEFRVSGLVPEDVLEDFGDVNVTTAGVSTVLSGTVGDQSALLGLLARLRALGLDVIEVHRVLDASDVDSGQEPI
jgi:hypothetical protein